jgi:hypothetical protein
MARWKVAVAAIVCLSMLGACHADPFSIKPETNATVPEKAPAADTLVEPLEETEAGPPPR